MIVSRLEADTCQCGAQSSYGVVSSPSHCRLGGPVPALSSSVPARVPDDPCPNYKGSQPSQALQYSL